MVVPSDAAEVAARVFGSQGGPWEFNLRDLLRWCELAQSALAPGVPSSLLLPSAPALPADHDMDAGHPVDHGMDAAAGPLGPASAPDLATALDESVEAMAHMLFSLRLRTHADRQQFNDMFHQAWGRPLRPPAHPSISLSPDVLLLGRARLPRAGALQPLQPGTAASATAAVAAAAAADAPHMLPFPPGAGPALHLLSWQLPVLDSMAMAVARGWMVLLVGGAGAGKTKVARLLAQLCGRSLLEVPLTAATDTSDLLGSFEQMEPARRIQEAGSKIQKLANDTCQHLLCCVEARGEEGGGDVVAERLRLCEAVAGAWRAFQQMEEGGGVEDGMGGGSGHAGVVEQHKHAFMRLQEVATACHEAFDQADLQDHAGRCCMVVGVWVGGVGPAVCLDSWRLCCAVLCCAELDPG